MFDSPFGSKPFSLWSWGTLLGGAVAWLVQLLVLYVLAEFGCVLNWQQARFLGMGAVTWGVVVATLLALLISLWCCWLAWISKRKIDRQIADRIASGQNDEVVAKLRPESLETFLLRFGIINNAMFALIIVAQGLPILFYLNWC
jgi:hypothetical protein